MSLARTFRAAVLTLAAIALYCAGPLTLAARAGSPDPVSEETVQAVAARLRCVVCQNLSVADSPSEMANQMRGIIRERLAAGDSPDQVVAYFVDKYGEWILLSPTWRGFNLLVWTAPLVAVLAGLGVVGFLLRRWTRIPPVPGAAASIDPVLRERVRREMETRP